MKAIAAAFFAGGALLCWPASAQTDTPPPPAANDLVLRPLGGLVPVPAPSGLGPRLGRASGVSEMRDAPPPPPPPPSKAAEFSLKDGPMEIRIRCSDDEPIKACADAALAVMEKFSGMAAKTSEPPATDQPQTPTAQ